MGSNTFARVRVNPRGKAAQTHCLRGHEFNEANTYWKSTGQRSCRACTKLRDVKRRHPSAPATGPDRYWAYKHGHGNPNSREYRTWHGMKARCGNPLAPNFPRYGGRGIFVCARWAESFEHFLADMGPRPEGQSLDRIDNDGNYEPGNCRWATSAEQMLNCSRNRYATHEGVTRTATQWARILDLDGSYVCKQLRRGLSIADLLVRQPRGGHRPKGCHVPRVQSAA